METKHIEEATTKGYENLGPSYFSARDTARTIMDGFEAEQFKPLIDKFSQKFAEKLWESVEASLMVDTECNIQGNIWRDVDAIVGAILGGEQWALQRYVLKDNINCEEVRASVAKFIPQEIMDKRIADLERENRDLTSTLKTYREMR